MTTERPCRASWTVDPAGQGGARPRRPARIADKGYFSGAEILACHPHDPAAPGNLRQPEEGHVREGRLPLEPDQDVYRCPAGNTSAYRYTREEDGLQVRRYRIKDCQHCPLQRRCTSGKERRITRGDHEHLIDEMRQRLGRDPDPITLRRSTVEHPFGTIKARMGTTHFQMRRLKNVRTEMALHGLAYNIKRTISLVGVRHLLAAIPT